MDKKSNALNIQEGVALNEQDLANVVGGDIGRCYGYCSSCGAQDISWYGPIDSTPCPSCGRSGSLVMLDFENYHS